MSAKIIEGILFIIHLILQSGKMVLISNLRTDEKMKDIYIKDKFNRDIAAIEFESPIHDKVIMSKHNYFTHIISSHPEINLEIIQSVAETPDKIFEVLKKDRLFYYEKAIDNKIYIVVMEDKEYFDKLFDS